VQFYSQLIRIFTRLSFRIHQTIRLITRPLTQAMANILDAPFKSSQSSFLVIHPNDRQESSQTVLPHTQSTQTTFLNTPHSLQCSLHFSIHLAPTGISSRSPRFSSRTYDGKSRTVIRAGGVRLLGASVSPPLPNPVASGADTDTEGSPPYILLRQVGQLALTANHSSTH